MEQSRKDIRKCFSINNTCANSSDSHDLALQFHSEISSESYSLLFASFLFVYHISSVVETQDQSHRPLNNFLRTKNHSRGLSFPFIFHHNNNIRTRRLNLQFQSSHSTGFPCFSPAHTQSVPFISKRKVIIFPLVRVCHLNLSKSLNHTLPCSPHHQTKLYTQFSSSSSSINVCKKKKSNLRKTMFSQASSALLARDTNPT